MLDNTRCLWMICDLSENYGDLRTCLDSQQSAKHLKFPSSARATEYLLGRWLCCQLTQQKTMDDESGLPFIPTEPKLTLNISHCRQGNLLLIAAAASGAPVGIDCELIGKPRQRDALAKKWFADTELAWMNSVVGSEAVRFCKLWTAKEAHIKYMRSSIAESLTDTVMTIDTAGAMGTSSTEIAHHLPDSDVVIAVAKAAGNKNGISFQQAKIPT